MIDDNDIPDLPEDEVEEVFDNDPDWEKGLDKKANGENESTLHNARLYLENHPDLKGCIVWNEYAKRLEIMPKGLLKRFAEKQAKKGKRGRKRPRAEKIVSACQDALAHDFGISVSYHDLQKRIVDVAEENAYNPLIDHLKSLKWDGVSRIDNLFIRYFGAGQTVPEEEEKHAHLAHLRRISRRWLLGAVERAFRPGCKVDNVLILEGVQGARKTSALEILGGAFYCSTQINLGDKDSKMIAASNWLIDMPDTQFMKKESRGFITMREDTFRPPFGAAVEKTLRMCVLIGSMNDYQYFEEDERRYWPVRCGTIDLVALRHDRDQIWAEAVAISLASETCPACLASEDTVAGQAPRCSTHRWWLDADEEKVSLKEAAERVCDVPWKLLIHEWWLDMSIDMRPSSFTTEDIAIGVMKIDEAAFARGDKIATAIGMAVKSLGFIKERKMIGGVRHWVYRPTLALAQAPQEQKPRRGLFVMTGGKATSEKNPPATKK